MNKRIKKKKKKEREKRGLLLCRLIGRKMEEEEVFKNYIFDGVK
jgi:hypothetical protein